MVTLHCDLCFTAFSKWSNATAEKHSAATNNTAGQVILFPKEKGSHSERRFHTYITVLYLEKPDSINTQQGKC